MHINYFHTLIGLYYTNGTSTIQVALKPILLYPDIEILNKMTLRSDHI